MSLNQRGVVSLAPSGQYQAILNGALEGDGL